MANWYSLNKYSANQLADQIYYMLMNADNASIAVPPYGGMTDPISLKEAINLATNKVLVTTGQIYLNEKQMNIIRRIDPDFLGDSNVQQQEMGVENVQTGIAENGQGVEEVPPQI